MCVCAREKGATVRHSCTLFSGGAISANARAIKDLLLVKTLLNACALGAMVEQKHAKGFDLKTETDDVGHLCGKKLSCSTINRTTTTTGRGDFYLSLSKARIDGVTLFVRFLGRDGGTDRLPLFVCLSVCRKTGRKRVDFSIRADTTSHRQTLCVRGSGSLADWKRESNVRIEFFRRPKKSFCESLESCCVNAFNNVVKLERLTKLSF